jgi:hypothetical protein
MKVRAVLALIIVAALPKTCEEHALSQGASRSVKAPRVDLDLGPVTVWLGMSQKQATSEFSNAGYVLDPLLSTGEVFYVYRGEAKGEDFLGQVSFQNGRLVYASHGLPSDEDSYDSAFSTLTNFAQKGLAVCSLSARPLIEPRRQSQRVWIRCGDRTLFLLERTVPRKSNSVEEWIGEIPSYETKP